MSGLRYLTGGESHGLGITVLIEGLPFGFSWDEAFVNEALQRRQHGYGRSKRQQIERDQVKVLGGLKKGKSTGGPLVLFVENKDQSIERLPNLKTPRPGHADLVGCLKNESDDIRAVLERASARETAGRVAAGASAALFLQEFGIRCFAHVTQIGSVRAKSSELSLAKATTQRNRSPFFSLDSKADQQMRKLVDQVSEQGDSLGGVFEIWVDGLPPGLGDYSNPTQRLGSRLGAAILSIPAIKGFEIGLGFEAARLIGSQVQDEILWKRNAAWGGFTRKTNRLGGLEGGMSNGQRLILRAAMKPISTLRKGLQTVDLHSKKATRAVYQRSDVCAVPAASVVGENLVAFEIASAFLEKFAGDSMQAVRRSFKSYQKSLSLLS